MGCSKKLIVIFAEGHAAMSVDVDVVGVGDVPPRLRQQGIDRHPRFFFAGHLDRPPRRGALCVDSTRDWSRKGVTREGDERLVTGDRKFVSRKS